MIWIILLIIVGGGLMALLGASRGVYFMLATLFNLLMAIYLSVLSAPLVLKSSPALEGSGYYSAFCTLLLVAAIFLVLEGISYYLFLRGADILLPVWFDKIGGAVFGFISAYLIIGVIALVICMMPFSRLDFFEEIVPQQDLQKVASKTVLKSCGFIGCWSLECLEETPKEILEYLFAHGEGAFPAARESSRENSSQSPPRIGPVPADTPPAGALPLPGLDPSIGDPNLSVR